MTATFEAWRDGAEPFPHTWASDMVWRIEGHSVESKEYTSKQGYIEEFVKPFGARFRPSDRFRPTHIRAVHADGNTVIVLWDGRGIATDGQPYENTCLLHADARRQGHRRHCAHRQHLAQRPPRTRSARVPTGFVNVSPSLSADCAERRSRRRPRWSPATRRELRSPSACARRAPTRGSPRHSSRCGRNSTARACARSNAGATTSSPTSWSGSRWPATSGPSR
jgi:ketosteroid isomerase-like protein